MFDESEVREFVKKMGFKPDPSGPDWEEKLVDALTGKDKSENAGWGSVYYNSDKVLQFLEKYDMLGQKGINQRQAISKLKRLLKSGKWKEDEDMRINENQKVTLTLGQLKKLVNENTAEPEGDLIPDLDAFLERELSAAVDYDKKVYEEEPGSFEVYDHSDECGDPDTYEEMGLDPSEVKIWQYVEVWIEDSQDYDYYLDLIHNAAERFAKQPFGDTISPDYEVSGNNSHTIMVAYTDTDVDAK